MKKGFTLLEMIVGLFCCSLIFIIIQSYFLVLIKISNLDFGIEQNEIGIVQLQYLVNTASDFELVNNSVCYQDNEEKQFCLYFDRNRLVKTPGYEILLTEIEQGQITFSYPYLVIEGEKFNEKLEVTY